MSEIENREAPHALRLSDNRSMAKMVLLGIITAFIYPTIISYYMCEDLNLIASPHDGRRTMHPVAATFLAIITLGIYYFVWEHQRCKRIESELLRRKINYKFGASTFWLWGILGILIIIGPFVYLHKYCKAMNYLAADYNRRG